MQDYFNEHFEWVGGVPRRKKRVLPDGAQLHVPMQPMDHSAIGFFSSFADGSPDHTSQ